MRGDRLARVAAPLLTVAGLALLGSCESLQGGALGGLADLASFVGADSRTVTTLRVLDIGARTAGAWADAKKSPFTAEQEYYLGRSVAANILHQYTVYSDAAATEYVNLIGQSLALYSDRPTIYHGYTFLILDSEEINAFATPGGHIFVTRGMVRLTRSEDELAAVLAHEIAHVASRHGVEAIRSARVVQAFKDGGFEAFDVLAGSDLKKAAQLFGDATSDVVDTLTTRGYSGQMERDADLIAVQILHAVGYDPHAIVEVLQRMDEAQKAQYEGSARRAGFSRTHPRPSSRVADLQRAGLSDLPAGSRIDSRAAQARFDARTRGL